jgi:hypothetical protein
MAKAPLVIELDTSKLHEAIDNLPDELLDRLAAKVAERAVPLILERLRKDSARVARRS